MPDPTPTPGFSPEAIAELRSKWERYADRLREGDGGGSLVGAAYIIAKTAVADIPALLAALEAAQKEPQRVGRPVLASLSRRGQKAVDGPHKAERDAQTHLSAAEAAS